MLGKTPSLLKLNNFQGPATVNSACITCGKKRPYPQTTNDPHNIHKRYPRLCVYYVSSLLSCWIVVFSETSTSIRSEIF